MKTITLIAFACVVTSTFANDWPFYRGPNLNGSIDANNWNPDFSANGPRVAWRKELGIGASSFTIVGNQVLTTGNQGGNDVLWCLNAEDGSVHWEYRIPCKFEKRMFEGGTASTPTIHDGVVYNLSYDGQLHAVDLASGKKIWSKHLLKDYQGKLSRWKYAGSPLITNGKLFLDVGGKTNSTLALDPKTGNQVWGVGRESAGYSTIIPFKQGRADALLVFKGESMLGLAQQDGKQLWRIPWKTSYDVNASSPIALDNNRILISSGYRGGRAALLDISGTKPRQLWRNDDVKTKMSSCVVHGNYAYAVTEKKGLLMCVDLATGKTQWSERGTGQYGTLIAAGNTLIVLSDGGELWTVKADGKAFQLIARGNILDGRCWVTPAFANGRIYAKTNKGKMACVDVRAR